jgi:peroxiredoxin Q/BCP
VLVFGVSFDDAPTNRAFAEKYDFPFPLLCDTERAMGLAFGTCAAKETKWSSRHTFVVDPDGDIEQAIDTKDPAGQAEELARTIRGD